MALQWNDGPFRGSYTTNTFSTGRAQPIQPPSLGNQYGQQPPQITDMQYRGNIPIPKGAPQSVVDYMTNNPDKWTRGQPTQSRPVPPQGGGTPYRSPAPSLGGSGGYNPGWGVMPGPSPPSQGIPHQPPAQGTPQGAAPQPRENSIRMDPDSGKMVTYKNGQWTWEPSPISGSVPYDTSRFGDGTPPGSPIAGPAQGTPYRQPPSQPQYGTPPDKRNGARMADWRDADKDGVDDRDQDGPGMPAYGLPGQARPIQPPAQGTPYQPSAPTRHPAYDSSRTNPYMPPDPTPWTPQLTGEERRKALIAPRQYSPEEAAQRQRIADLRKEAEKLTAPKAPAYDLSNYYRKLPPGLTAKRPPQRS